MAQYRFYPPAACCAPAVTDGECQCQPEEAPAPQSQADYALAA